MNPLTIIVAYDAQHGIGINNKLPWHLSEDLLRFKSITSNHAIIMGRKTFDSIGKPLPNRRNIVLTRNATWRHDGVEVVHSFHQALELIGGIKAFIIGGAELFRQALPLCDQILATEIQHHFNCDAFFTPIDKNDWKETERETHYSEKNQFEYAFVTYSRIRKH